MFFSKLVIVAFTLAAAVAAVPAPASAKSLQSRAPKVHLMAARQEDTYNPETNSWSCQGPDGVGGCDDNGVRDFVFL